MNNLENIRNTYRSKRRALQQISDYAKSCDLPVTYFKYKTFKVFSKNNLIVGNIKRAKKIIAVGYTTDNTYLWYKDIYYPLKTYYNKAANFLGKIIPVLILYSLIYLLIYISQIVNNIRIQYILGVVALLWMYGVAKYAFLGSTRYFNASRGNSGLACVFELMANHNQDVAYVFFDRSDYQNMYQELQVIFKKNNTSPFVLQLDALGSDGEVYIGYHKNAKGARTLTKANEKVHVKKIDEREPYLKEVTKHLLLTTGKIDDKGELVIIYSYGNRDKKCNEENLAISREVIQTFIYEKNL